MAGSLWWSHLDQLIPQPEFLEQSHEIDLEWGLRSARRLTWRDWLCLLTGKTVDMIDFAGVRPPTTLARAYALFGAERACDRRVRA